MSKVKNLSVSMLKKNLIHFSHSELINLLVECYKLNSEVQGFLAVKLDVGNTVEQLYENYKKQIENQFFPTRGEPRLNLKDAKKAISDFKKITGNSRLTFELMLFYVEMGVSFTNCYGDINSTFYRSMESMYAKIVEILNEEKDNGLFIAYKVSIEKVLSDTEGIGWGFHDNLVEIYFEIEWIEEIEIED